LRRGVIACTVLPPAYFTGLFIIDGIECRGPDAYRLPLYTKSPGVWGKKKDRWPAPGSSLRISAPMQRNPASPAASDLDRCCMMAHGKDQNG